MAGFLGMRGSGQFTTNELPQDWDQVIMREYPNGQTPIFAIQSMMPEETVASSDYNWWTETVPAYSGAVIGVYIDAALSTLYVYATHKATKGIAGATVYVKLAEADALMAVVGQTVALRDADRPTATVRGRVTAQSINGTSSYVAVQLIEADDNSIDGDGTSNASTYNLATVDRFIFMASAYPWGSGTPQASSYTPVQYSNRTQIHRTVFSLSRTAKSQQTRTGDVFDNDRIRTMYKHAQGWEWTAIFGHNYATVDPDSKQPPTSWTSDMRRIAPSLERPGWKLERNFWTPIWSSCSVSRQTISWVSVVVRLHRVSTSWLRPEAAFNWFPRLRTMV